MQQQDDWPDRRTSLSIKMLGSSASTVRNEARGIETSPGTDLEGIAKTCSCL